MRIKTKMLIPMIALTILVAAAILISNIFLFSSQVDATSHKTVETASEISMTQLEDMKLQAMTASLYISKDDTIAAALSSGDSETLLAQSLKMQNETGMEFCTITDMEGTVILRSHEPGNKDDSVISQANIAAAVGGSNFTAIETGSAVKLSVRSGSPIFDAQGTQIGVVSVGYRLDTEEFVDSVKALTKCETTVFLGDERISTTVLKADGTRAVGTKAGAEIAEQVLSGTAYTGPAMILDRAALANYTPIAGVDGEIVGMLFSGEYSDVKTSTIWSFVQSGLIVTLILLVVSVAVILIIIRKIVAPIHSMVEAAETLAQGDTDVDVSVNSKDEMRDLAEAFNRMIANTRQQVEIIKHIADGDLTVSLKSRSEKDAMNNALISMIDLNNSVFSNITVSADQVAQGAQQVADGAQALAAGATQQAAAIAELSNSMSEIADRTRENADKAENAARLAESIKGSAEKGSDQMNDMIKAVKDINQSGQDISKIIKVIDDIAFQTNILALNAAVEAARAGQHGKGFAVVAEEVRNLAAKSAEAANNTENLIATSIQRAEQGVRIAGETAESLAEIVTGINESSLIVAEIAVTSESQSVAIQQVNIGIDQVAQVVQQNSATAQESASASQEMSGQSAMLQDLVSQFKLKETLIMQNSLYGSSGRAPKLPARARRDIHAASFSADGKY